MVFYKRIQGRHRHSMSTWNFSDQKNWKNSVQKFSKGKFHEGGEKTVDLLAKYMISPKSFLSSLIKRVQELPCGPVVKTPKFPMQGAQIPSLVKELRSYMLI